MTLRPTVPVVNQEAYLVNKLLLNYDPHVKPTVLSQTTMQVYITFGLTQIQGLVRMLTLI